MSETKIKCPKCEKTMTSAEKVADIFGNDGLDFDSDHGDLETVCLDQFDAEYSDNVAWINDDQKGSYDQVFLFSDGSYVAVSGCAWDISDDSGCAWGGSSLA
tara:strand:- start:393 stop:698 length:306 start_codon:yes stop_codon:yes gene_type:complete